MHLLDLTKLGKAKVKLKQSYNFEKLKVMLEQSSHTHARTHHTCTHKRPRAKNNKQAIKQTLEHKPARRT